MGKSTEEELQRSHHEVLERMYNKIKYIRQHYLFYLYIRLHLFYILLTVHLNIFILILTNSIH